MKVQPSHLSNYAIRLTPGVKRHGLTALGLVLHLVWHKNNDAVIVVDPKHFWISFGEQQRVSTTLLRGPIVNRYHTVAFTRDVVTNELQTQKDLAIFREICFEYICKRGDLIDDEDSDAVMDRLPDFQWKRDIMLQGQRVAVDSTVSGATIEYKLSKLDSGEVVESGELDVEGMSVRMESSHFVQEFPENGTWKVADLDNFLIYPRVLEEEE
ncbi:hypothetical protein HDU98_000064 [Podochytrium sp. JEL0797]|nr:hypothetical protein HDU98_000064 [Podochytrium sp. JEL0797]